MDTKLIYLLAFVFMLKSCDPDSGNKSFLIENLTTKDLNVKLYQQGNTNNIDLFQNNKLNILEFNALGGGFNAIADFDSIKIFDAINNRKIEWIKPNNNYGYIDTENNIGTERDVPNDIYNRNNWTLRANGDDEEWMFILNESDLELFEE